MISGSRNRAYTYQRSGPHPLLFQMSCHSSGILVKYSIRPITQRGDDRSTALRVSNSSLKNL